jgi:ubiquinone/menaquinone biosynthesis C-methylase UbiE
MQIFSYHSKHHYSFTIFLTTLLVCSTVVKPPQAKEQNVSPGINKYYYDAEFDHWVSVFERPGREVYDKRDTITAALDLKSGMHVADVGAGTGFFTQLFAQQVGESGRIYAVDISENFIKHILQIARSQGRNNIEGIVNTQKSTQLPAKSVDLVFICDTYHHFEYPQSMLASIYHALHKNGQLVIIDFRKKPGVSSGWVMSHVRANEEDVIREVETAGFKLIEQPELLQENFFLKFIKIDN